MVNPVRAFDRAVPFDTNPRAVIGGNFPPIEEEKLPPKHLRVLDYARAAKIEKAAKLLSALSRVAKKHILEKRTGGEEGRAVRRFLIVYARGIGSPVWECAEIFDLNRKQIGQEEADYLKMLADNPELEEDADWLTTMLDAGLRVNIPRFMAASIAEIEADNAERRAIKASRRAACKVDVFPPKRYEPQTEVEKLLAGNERKRRISKLKSDIAICVSVIEKAGDKGATKTQKQDAKAAASDLEIAYAELRRLERANAA